MTRRRTERPWRLLLVEDNPGDVLLVRRCLAASGVDVELVVIEDGDEALAHLHRQGNHSGAPRPDVVLLDLDLPGRDGHQVLAAIKDDPDLRTIPVCILTSSARPEDVTAAYDGRANSYVTKPRDLDGFQAAVADIARYWLDTVELPGGTTP